MSNTRCKLVAILAGTLATLTGCAKHSEGDLQTEYGERNELEMAASVNGYSVLAEMFTKAGYTVSKRADLSDGLKNVADAIVYAPDSFAPPPQSTIDWCDRWLKEKAGRTLIYIGRDFDAAPNYWRKIRPQVAAKHQAEVDRRLQAAIDEFDEERRAAPEQAECDWFAVDTTAPHLNVRILSGDWDLDNVDVAKTEIELNSRIAPRGGTFEDRDSLLSGNGETIVFRRQLPAARGLRFWLPDPTSQLIVVANGSFLVNLQLVNKEHRKLAGKLIDEVPKGSRVVFIEADAPSRVRSGGGGGGPQETAGIFDVFGVWPLSVILIQWIIVLALFCFSRWPIFGPPRDPAPAPASDFSRHIEALAETWEITRDSSYARDRWQYYQQHVRSEPGTVAAKRKR